MGISIDEFVGKLDKMAAAYGSDASDVLEEGAKDMQKALRKDSPVGHAKHKHKLKNSWKMEVIDRLDRNRKLTSGAPLLIFTWSTGACSIRKIRTAKTSRNGWMPSTSMWDSCSVL